MPTRTLGPEGECIIMSHFFRVLSPELGLFNPQASTLYGVLVLIRSWMARELKLDSSLTVMGFAQLAMTISP